MDASWRLLVIAVLVAALLIGTATAARTAPLIVDHTSTDLSTVPASAIADAKATLHIAYGHTSHGSQLVGGMSGLTSFAGAPLPPSTYAFNEGGTGGALDLDDYFAGGDLGNPDFSTWASLTRTYLNRPENHDVNVVMWSWCGEVSGASEANIDTYLSLMDALERDYPNGHVRVHDRPPRRLRGLGEPEPAEQPDPRLVPEPQPGPLRLRRYRVVRPRRKRLPRPRRERRSVRRRRGRNWAQAWQNSHTVNVDWYSCDAGPHRDR